MLSIPVGKWWWTKVGQIAIPVLLIGGMLIFIFKEPVKIKRFIIGLMKYVVIPVVAIWLIVLIIVVVIESHSQKKPKLVLEPEKKTLGYEVLEPEQPTTKKKEEGRDLLQTYGKDIEESKAKWRQLQKGMTESQVRALLGEPNRIDASSLYATYWYYYRSGEVLFNPDNNRVKGWKEYYQ